MVDELRNILAHKGETHLINDFSRYTIDSAARNVMSVGIIKKDTKSKEPKPPKGSFYLLDKYDGVEIIRAHQGKNTIYNLLLPELEPDEWKTINSFKEQLLRDPSLDTSFITEAVQDKKIFADAKKALWSEATQTISSAERRNVFSEEIERIIRAEGNQLSEEKIEIFTDLLTKSIMGYGLLEYLLEDDQLEEIMVLGVNKRVYVIHRTHGMCSTNLIFEDDDDAVNIINRIAEDAGKKINSYNPLLDACIKDGSRVNATLRQVTPSGATLTIRKFSSDPLTVIDLIKNETISIELTAWLWLAVDGLGINPSSIIISGGTSSGKTTTLNCLSSFIPEGDRVISIEDTLEMQTQLREHWIQMETRPALTEGEQNVDMNTCLINTLRMRPDRIIVGEVRGSEADTLFAAMNTGHDGCMGTLHANDSKETITRLTNPPMNVPMIMLPALNLIIVQNRFKHPQKGNIRRISEVTEIAGMEEGKVLMNKIFKYNIKIDKIVETGTPSRYLQELSKKMGIRGDILTREIEKRAEVLRRLVETNRRSIDQVHEAINTFNRESELKIQ